MKTENEKLRFESDYMEGALPQILGRISEINMQHCTGYGLDDFSESARQKIRAACSAPEADIFFLAGGTQSNLTVIDAVLKPWQGVIAADTGHVSVHEAGAIEHGGHKVITISSGDGKINAQSVDNCCSACFSDDNRDHMVMPGMVYISQPTELGTLYSLEELTDISRVCRKYGISLYLDGARLAYALACPDNTVTLKDLAELCDVFYIGGTKCGALFGEAVVVPKHDFIPHFFTMIKQHGALLAKGHITGIQFDVMFTEGLYESLGRSAIEAADRIRNALAEKGYTLVFNSPTNQIFVLMDNSTREKLSADVGMSFWEKADESHTIMRFVTSWATSPQDVDRLISLL